MRSLFRSPGIRLSPASVVIVAVASGALAVSQAGAQEVADEPSAANPFTASVGIGVSGVAPSGEFGEVVDSGWGVMGHLSGQFLGGWLGARLDGGYVEYGAETSHDYLMVRSTPITLDLSTKNTIWLFGVGPEFTLPTSGLRPHVYALAGLAYFRTRTSVSTETELDVPIELESTTHLSDTTFGFTLGGGLVVPFATSDGVVFAASVDAAYRTYGDTRYLREGSVTDVDGRAVFTPIESKTSFWEIRVGVWIGT